LPWLSIWIGTLRGAWPAGSGRGDLEHAVFVARGDLLGIDPVGDGQAPLEAAVADLMVRVVPSRETWGTRPLAGCGRRSRTRPRSRGCCSPPRRWWPRSRRRRSRRRRRCRTAPRTSETAGPRARGWVRGPSATCASADPGGPAAPQAITPAGVAHPRRLGRAHEVEQHLDEAPRVRAVRE